MPFVTGVFLARRLSESTQCCHDQRLVVPSTSTWYTTMETAFTCSSEVGRLGGGST